MKSLLLSGAAVVLCAGSGLAATPLNEATVTRVVRNVEVIPDGGAPTPAAVGEVIRGGSDVRTGRDSRAQLTFPDQTLARLGENTLFSFQRGTRALDLEGGAILLQVPKDAGGATIRSAPVTAAITGTTLMMEYSPGDPGMVKLIVLEGTVRLSLAGRLGESVLVGPGQMIAVAANASRLPEPSTVNVRNLLRTSRLIRDGQLEAMGLILETVDQQEQMVRDGRLTDGPPQVGPGNVNPANAGASVLNAQNLRRDTVTPPASGGQQAPPPPQPPNPEPAAGPPPGPGPPPPPFN